MPSTERRLGVRKSIRGKSEQGSLKVRGRHFPVLVVDQSVRGLGLVGVNLRPISVGAVVHFTGKSGESECRVASVEQISLAGTAIFRLGLEWVD